MNRSSWLSWLSTGGSRSFPQPCVGSSLQLSQLARAHLHRVLSTAVELLVKSEKLSPRVSQSIRAHFPSRTQSGDTTCSCLQPTPTDVQILREGGAGRLPGAEPNPQVTGLGSETSGRIRLHRPLPAPPRTAPTQQALVPPASHRPPVVGLPASDQGKSFQGLCSQSKGPRCQSIKNFDKG